MSNPTIQTPCDLPSPLGSSLSASDAGVVAFIAVANEGSFSRAAERLGTDRSAVSRKVRKLEEQLGARLFLRTTRNTTITNEGNLFYENCRTGVGRTLQALEHTRDLRDGPTQGLLRISASRGFGRQVVAPLLTEFRSHYPEVSLELLPDDGDLDLSKGLVDVAFRDGRMQDSRIIAVPLAPMRMVVCAADSYHRAHGLPSSLDELSAHDCINLRLASGRLQSWEFDIEGRSHHLTPTAHLVVNDGVFVLRATLNGEGVAQLPACMVGDALAQGKLLTCLEPFAPRRSGHFLCYLGRPQLPKRIRAFVDFIYARIRRIDGHSPQLGS